MYIVRSSLLLRKLYPSAIWRIPTKEKKIFLTFDDGPVPEVTPQVLSILRDYKAKATFFCVGANIEKHPEIFRQIISEGHSIGNHTYHHLNGWKTKTKEYLENVEKCKKIMQAPALKGEMVKTTLPQEFPPLGSGHLFRPPYGKMKLSQYSLLRSHYSIVMWDVLSGDFDRTISEKKCLRNVLSKTRAGSILVFHDSWKARKNLFFVLPKAMEKFSADGFTFAPVPPMRESCPENK